MTFAYQNRDIRQKQLAVAHMLHSAAYLDPNKVQYFHVQDVIFEQDLTHSSPDYAAEIERYRQSESNEKVAAAAAMDSMLRATDFVRKWVEFWDAIT